MSRTSQIDGLPVIDAKHPLTIHVQKRDITKSDPKQPDQCAVAQACKRELHCIEVRVHLARVYIRTNDSNWQRYIVPKSMRQEIVAFDRGGTFEPNDFEIRPPQPSQTAGARAKRAASGKHTGTGKKHRKYHVLRNVRGWPA